MSASMERFGCFFSFLSGSAAAVERLTALSGSLGLPQMRAAVHGSGRRRVGP
jgi:hypothetical protein